MDAASFLPEWIRDRSEFKTVERASDPVSILQRPFSERSRPGEEALSKQWLRTHVKLLEKLPRQQLDAISEGLTCASYHRGDVIRAAGGDDRFCIVLSGKVAIGCDGFGGRLPLPDARSSVASAEAGAADLAELVELAGVPNGLKRPQILSAGDSFGPYGILQRQTLALPVTAIVRSHVLSMPNTDVQGIQAKFAEQTQTAIINFLQTLALFSTWSRSRLTRLSHLMTHRLYPPGEVLARQGDPPLHMFFVKQGICRIERVNRTKHSTRWPRTKHEWETREWEEVEVLNLGQLHAGMYFGEASILQGEPRFASVIAETVVEVVALHAKYLLHLGNTLDQLQKRQNMFETERSVKRQYESLQRELERANDPVRQVLKRAHLDANRPKQYTTAASMFGAVTSEDGGGGGGGGGGTAAGRPKAIALFRNGVRRVAADGRAKAISRGRVGSPGARSSMSSARSRTDSGAGSPDGSPPEFRPIAVRPSSAGSRADGGSPGPSAPSPSDSPLTVDGEEGLSIVPPPPPPVSASSRLLGRLPQLSPIHLAPVSPRVQAMTSSIQQRSSPRSARDSPFERCDSPLHARRVVLAESWSGHDDRRRRSGASALADPPLFNPEQDALEHLTTMSMTFKNHRRGSIGETTRLHLSKLKAKAAPVPPPRPPPRAEKNADRRQSVVFPLL